MKKGLLLAAVALCSASAFAQSGKPVTVTGFNADGFFAPDLEDTGATARGPLDGHASKFLYAFTDCNEGTVYIPENGQILGVDGETVYQLGDPTGLNTLCLSNDEYWADHMSGTLAFAKPAKAQKIGFLEAAGNLGSNSFAMTVQINYTDGTNQTVSLKPSEWSEVNGKSVFKTQARYRFTYSGNEMGIEDKTGEGGYFNIHEQVIDADPTKTVESLTFTNDAAKADDWGWHYINVFAVSVFAPESAEITNGPVALAGFNADGFFAPDLEDTGATARGPLDGHASKFLYAFTDCNEETVYIPEDGKLLGVDGKTEYQLADPTGLNTLCLSNDEYWADHMSGTLTFEKPVKASKVGFLEAAGNLGSSSFGMDVQVNYTDGTNDVVSLKPSEWSEVNGKTVFKTQARYRFTFSGNEMGIEDKTGEGGYFNIHEQVINTNGEKTIESMTFTNTAAKADDWGWHYLNVFAISAIQDAEGIDTVLAPVTVDNRVYDLQGRPVQNLVPGQAYIRNRRTFIQK